MALEISGRKSKQIGEMSYINDSFVAELNIYNQACLTRESALRKVHVIEKTPTEMAVIFSLEGELKGSIICTVDLDNKEIDKKEAIFFQSLYMESMNILLGSFLTNLESISSIMSVISSPKYLKPNDYIPGGISDNLAHFTVWSLEYCLHTLKENFDCKIYIVANKKSIIEV